MKNRDLKTFYSRVYTKKGERKHYTKLLFRSGAIPSEEKEALKEVSWKGKTVLDVGCGTGLLCHEIAKRGAKRVIGIDFAEGAIEVARRTHQHPALEYRVEDLKKHRGAYDVIVSLGTLEHMDRPFIALKRMIKFLKPGGSLILTCPNWTNPRGYILQTIWQLFGIRITMADIHHLTPIEFQRWGKQLGLRLAWRTFDQDWGHGDRLIKDFTRRIPAIFKTANVPLPKKRSQAFIEWIQSHILPLDHAAPFSGATGLYHFRRK